MKISAIIAYLESVAPSSYQEHYDNAGLLTGNPDWECTGMLCTLDSTEEVIQEAINKNCNIILAHHPIIFGGLKRINGKNYVERAVIAAIKNDIALFAIHTNLDNVMDGVSGKIAGQLALLNRRILTPKAVTLKKLFTFVPLDHVEAVRRAIFDAGAGNIGNYSECSFNAEGVGTFKGNENTDPFVGEPGQLHYEKELKLEVVIPAHLQHSVVSALKKVHPYEEVAFDVVDLANTHPSVGSGLVGELAEPMDEKLFLELVRQRFKCKMIRHTPFLNKPVKTIAVCGGAGSFLIPKALGAGADVYITADLKYHEFFDADGKILICDIGHYESEQFTTDLLADILHKKFPTFAVLKSDIQTNPVQYYF
jgi:dinuclear metal center YbgI/SA1388 family protein